ncbi:MAG: hypothetical protein CMI08_19385 [Oceanospirillaceae bacterium]|nr:phage integrase N-terminal SAM-like domain-containing protein [Thalassolituus sp. UBA6592]MAS24708.1 hypothetical protein [Oceanospirillaceae bacterium]MAY01327.1 hypothetical protein [Oceanospirillaceae bacterium]MBS52301.1 hypothetical protein [Oceanospirillaceae bacterium]
MSRSPFLEDIRTYMRLRGMSLRTEKTYIYWIRNFIRYHGRLKWVMGWTLPIHHQRQKR